MYRDTLEFAKENGMEVKQLTIAWIRLVSPEMSRLDKIRVGIKWRWAALKRHVVKQKGLVKGIKKWWTLRKRCRECNKFLLKEAERAKRMGPAEPPTVDDVQDFIKEMGGNIDANCVERMPPTKRRNIDRDI